MQIETYCLFYAFCYEKAICKSTFFKNECKSEPAHNACCLWPVSYTHLDVYKRKAQYCDLIHSTHAALSLIHSYIPIIDLYFAKDGYRYRSLGCAPCTGKIKSNATTVDEIIEELRHTTTGERAGRAQDQEDAYAMQKLRKDGYM